MRIGILGGTFNPIHNGHLLIGEYARSSLDLDKIIFIPAGTHAFKDNRNILKASKRYKMVELAIKTNPYFQVSSYEIEKSGINYTVDTIRHLKEKYRGAVIYLIIGSDILFEIERWMEFNELIGLCKFALFQRQEDSLEKTEEKVLLLVNEYKMDIEKIPFPIFPISSSQIRERQGKNLSIKYLVQEDVEAYIKTNNLYREVKDE